MDLKRANNLPEPISGSTVRLQQRRVRKGTKSCWECKRKKARCSFTVSRSLVCDSCQKRGTPCIGQEQPEPVISGQPTDRLGRVEAMLCQLSNSTRLQASQQYSATSHLDESPAPSINSPLDATLRDLPTTLHPQQPLVSSEYLSHNTAFHGEGESHDRTLDTFLQAWPTEGDLSLISQIPVDTIHCVHDLLPISSITQHNTRLPKPYSLSQVLKPPLPKSHPTIYARLLLILALSLQAIDGENVKFLGGLAANRRKLMERAVDTAHGFLHFEIDESTITLEGVQCLALESLYYSFIGNLKRSWVIIRRAITLAQLMGLDQEPELSPPHPPKNQNQIVPQNLWFELINIDSYLCLVLGLPKFGFELNLAGSSCLDKFDPQTRLRRAHCAVAQGISKRNTTGGLEGGSTEELDKILRNSSSWMPPRWWSEPTPACNAYGQTSGAQEAARIRDQLTHYNLIVQLHWPNVIHPSSNESCYQSCLSAVNASRELLECFLAVSMHKTSGYYCRGISILALIASAVLCVSHTRVRSSPKDFSLSTYLLHQRPKDRGMMEQALESLEILSRTRADSSAPKMRDALQQLLIVEGGTTDGKGYEISSMKNYYKWPEYSYRWDSLSLEVCIPSFGCIQFKAKVIHTQASAGSASVDSHDLHDMGPRSMDLEAGEITTMSPLPSYDNNGTEWQLDLFGSFPSPEASVQPIHADLEL